MRMPTRETVQAAVTNRQELSFTATDTQTTTPTVDPFLPQEPTNRQPHTDEPSQQVQFARAGNVAFAMANGRNLLGSSSIRHRSGPDPRPPTPYSSSPQGVSAGQTPRPAPRWHAHAHTDPRARTSRHPPAPEHPRCTCTRMHMTPACQCAPPRDVMFMFRGCSVTIRVSVSGRLGAVG